MEQVFDTFHIKGYNNVNLDLKNINYMEKLEPLKELLKSFGLENNEAITYLEALKLGTSPASSIAKRVGVSRTSIRYTCEVLVNKGLMISSTKGNTKLFTAETPNKIKNLLIIEKNKLEEKEKKLDDNLDELYKLYNPYTKVPKMTFYEGEEGVKKVLEDHLINNIEIFSFIDMKNVINLSKKIQDWYENKKEKLNIKKNIILSTTKEIEEEFTKNSGDNKNTDIKYFSGKDLYIASYLYEGKFSYITLKKNKYFGVIIEDNEIYSFQKNIFDFIWKNSSKTLEENKTSD
ncbi:MAG: helix-turn-helix domain-containing protein [Candidatus Gracilibacteria bacterium]|nr:helix-turn-helix domain-containing protein [Candidatus Gracilibacteria bacterium]MDQ7022381.1 helix-turn-helix domain-containing protein [Candidatus Gracilibacteria bacterium]